MSEKFTSASLENLILDFRGGQHGSVFFQLPKDNALPGSNEAHLIVSNYTYSGDNKYLHIYSRETNAINGTGINLTFDQADELATYLQYFAKLGREKSGGS